MAASAAMLPGCRADISRIRKSVSGPARNTVHGCPSSLLNEPGGAITSPSGESTAARRSLVEVLPDEPVTPMIVSPPATSCAATAAASFASAASTAAPEPSLSCSSTLAALSPVGRRSGRPRSPAPRPAGPPAPRRHRQRPRPARSHGRRRRRPGSARNRAAGSHRAGIEFDGAGDHGARGVGGTDVGQLTADDLGDLGEGQLDHGRIRTPRSAAASSADGHRTAGSVRRRSGPIRGPCPRSAPHRRPAPSPRRVRWPRADRRSRPPRP